MISNFKCKLLRGVGIVVKTGQGRTKLSFKLLDGYITWKVVCPAGILLLSVGQAK